MRMINIQRKPMLEDYPSPILCRRSSLEQPCIDFYIYRNSGCYVWNSPVLNIHIYRNFGCYLWNSPVLNIIFTEILVVISGTALYWFSYLQKFWLLSLEQPCIDFYIYRNSGCLTLWRRQPFKNCWKWSVESVYVLRTRSRPLSTRT